MAVFSLGDCSIELAIEPLAGPLAAADRQVAWQVLLELVGRPGLQRDAVTRDALAALADALRECLGDWPAGQVERPKPQHLGPVLLTTIEFLLLPCLDGRCDGNTPPGWPAVRTFCRALAREIAERYGFAAGRGALPPDLAQAWEAQR